MNTHSKQSKQYYYIKLQQCQCLLQSVLSQQFDKHPIIILKDVKYAELRAMMDYMYRGEVNISQDQLAALLKAAESLQIKGLSDNKPSRPPSRPAPTPAAAHPPRAPSPPPQVGLSSMIYILGIPGGLLTPHLVLYIETAVVKGTLVCPSSVEVHYQLQS